MSYSPKVTAAAVLLGCSMATAQTTVPPSDALLRDYGSGIISFPSMFNIYWGDAWTKAPETSHRTYLDTFVRTVPASDDFTSVLHQYKDSAGHLIHQSHFAGSAWVPYTGIATTYITLTDTALETQIKNWASGGSGVIPNTSDTLYNVFLPPDMVITRGSLRSGRDFCTYHGSIASTNGTKIHYTVIPYFGTAINGAGCSPLPVYEQNTTVALSRAMANALTDPDGPASMAWHDPKYGDVGDICKGHYLPLSGYQVQSLYSNASRKCVSTALDFGITATTPGTLTTPVKSTISTTAIGPFPTNITLSVSGIPNVTAVFASPTITAGSSTTLTLTASSYLLAAGTVTVSVTGTSPTAGTSHVATFSQRIVPACPTARSYTFNVAAPDAHWPGGTQTVGSGSCALVVHEPKGYTSEAGSPWSITVPSNLSCTLRVFDPICTVGRKPGVVGNYPVCYYSQGGSVAATDEASVTCTLKQ